MRSGLVWLLVTSKAYDQEAKYFTTISTVFSIIRFFTTQQDKVYNGRHDILFDEN